MLGVVQLLLGLPTGFAAIEPLSGNFTKCRGCSIIPIDLERIFFVTQQYRARMLCTVPGHFERNLRIPAQTLRGHTAAIRTAVAHLKPLLPFLVAREQVEIRRASHVDAGPGLGFAYVALGKFLGTWHFSYSLLTRCQFMLQIEP